MNVFNLIAGAGGVSEGLYIWKKSEYVPSVTVTNPSIEVAVKDNSNITITSEEFNFSYFGEKSDSSGIADTTASELCTFLNGFTKDDYCRFQISSHRLMFAYGGLGNSYNSEVTKFVPNGKSATLTLLHSVKNEVFARGTYTYTGTKTIPAKIGDMVGYVISDKENAYPDGAEQGGFYYERFTPFDLAKDLNCTKYVTGTFTPTSNASYKSITHNFGTYAKFAVSWYAGWKAVPLNSAISTCFNIYADNGRGAESFVSGSSGQYINANTNVNTTSTTVCEIGNGSGGSKYYYSGREYHYIVFG